MERPLAYPIEQPHPTTKDFDPNRNAAIKPMGPIGLLIETVVWNGLVLDQNLRIWQKKGEPIDVLNMPYQNLKMLVYATAARARTRAEWNRSTTSTRLHARDIHREASQIDPKLAGGEKGMVRAAMMGGTLAKQEIAS